MTRKELSIYVHRNLNPQDGGAPKLTLEECETLVTGMFDCIKSNLVSGETVSIFDFGKFFPQERKGRMGRNPKTGAEVEIPTKVKAKFKAFPALESSLNK